MPDQSGFTLIEVTIAALFIFAGLLVYTKFFGSVIQKRASGTQESVAITLAQDKIEDIKNIAKTIRLDHGLTGGSGSRENPDYTSAGGWSSLADEVLDAEGKTFTSGVAYTRSWDVEPEAGENYLFAITVDVKWSNGTGSVTLETRISQ